MADKKSSEARVRGDGSLLPCAQGTRLRCPSRGFQGHRRRRSQHLRPLGPRSDTTTRAHHSRSALSTSQTTRSDRDGATRAHHNRCLYSDSERTIQTTKTRPPCLKAVKVDNPWTYLSFHCQAPWAPPLQSFSTTTTSIGGRRTVSSATSVGKLQLPSQSSSNQEIGCGNWICRKAFTFAEHTTTGCTDGDGAKPSSMYPPSSVIAMPRPCARFGQRLLCPCCGARPVADEVQKRLSKPATRASKLEEAVREADLIGERTANFGSGSAACC
ncbi:hypothetical protein V8E36_005015 [Tilletia maclaganii]